jgi:hypothetical protein
MKDEEELSEFGRFAHPLLQVVSDNLCFSRRPINSDVRPTPLI